MGHPAPATFFPFFTRRAGSVTALKRSEPTAAMLASQWPDTPLRRGLLPLPERMVYAPFRKGALRKQIFTENAIIFFRPPLAMCASVAYLHHIGSALPSWLDPIGALRCTSSLNLGHLELASRWFFSALIFHPHSAARGHP